MLNKISKFLVVAVFALIISGCAKSNFSHKYIMRGQVVSASNDVVVCAGTSDGSEVSQVLIVYRLVRNSSIKAMLLCSDLVIVAGRVSIYQEVSS